jgi:DnaJ-class molecular chaperone
MTEDQLPPGTILCPACRGSGRVSQVTARRDRTPLAQPPTCEKCAGNGYVDAPSA